jgi:hypothetical protein
MCHSSNSNVVAMGRHHALAAPDYVLGDCSTDTGSGGDGGSATGATSTAARFLVDILHAPQSSPR